MFVIEDGKLSISNDYGERWTLYFLFAYLERPPTDETLELFEAAHDRATAAWRDPDMLVSWLLHNSKTKAEHRRRLFKQKRWEWFQDRYGHRPSQDLLEIIAFFLNEKPGRIIPPRKKAA